MSETDAGEAPAAPLPSLNPTQQRTLDALRRTGDPLIFDQDLVTDIRHEVRAALDHFATRLDEGQEIFTTCSKSLSSQK